MPTKRLEQTRTAQTAWKAFQAARRGIKSIRCNGYAPAHMSNEGCHGTMLLTPEAIQHHIDNQHSVQPGTVGVYMTTEDSHRADPFWKSMSDACMEIIDFRCDVCGKIIPIHTQAITNHCKPHAGESRRIRPGGVFRVTFANQPAGPTEEELLEEEALV